MFALNCLQLICDSESPITVTSDLSPVESALQRFHKGNIVKLSAKDVSTSGDWEVCGKEFVCNSGWKTLSSSSSIIAGKRAKPWRSLTAFRGANACHQPTAKKRLVSTLVAKVTSANVTGKRALCMFQTFLIYVFS